MTKYGASIELYDRMTPILNNIISALDMTVSNLYSVQKSVDGLDSSGLDVLRDTVAKAEYALGVTDDRFEALKNSAAETISANVSVDTAQVTAAANEINAVKEKAEQTVVSQVDMDTSKLSSAASEINASKEKAEQPVVSSVSMDTSELASAASEINAVKNEAEQETVSQVSADTSQLTAAADEINKFKDKASEPVVIPTQPEETASAPEPTSSAPEPSFTWTGTGIDVFTNTGEDRFANEMQSALSLMNSLAEKQREISSAAAKTDIFPENAVADINSLETRLGAVQSRIRLISSNPANAVSPDAANAVESLREELSQALDIQTRMNEAVNDMDVSSANDYYNRLNAVISRTEREIRDNTDAQGAFNSAVDEGVSGADSLKNAISGVASAFGLYKIADTVKDGFTELFTLSDEMTQTSARLNLMNDGLQTTAELQNMVYSAAQNSRGSYSDMASVVAKFGNNAKDAFSSSEEVVAFSELIQKSLKISGASATEASSAMLQLSQALGSGVLRGDELNSIFEASPNLIQYIADYLDVGIGEIREMASEGQITADVVKNAIFAAADDTNEKFKSLPMTWSDVITDFKNEITVMFEPVLNEINALANNSEFLEALDIVKNALSYVGGAAAQVIELMASGVIWVSNNWDVLSSVLSGVAVAVGAVAAAYAVWNAYTAIQNALMYASPVTWIITGVTVLIAAIVAVCSYIAKTTDAAESALGVVTGAINVVLQFLYNLITSVANVTYGIKYSLDAVCDNIQIKFKNTILSVKSWFYDLMYSATGVIINICEALNKLPFVNFDYSGLTAKANEYAESAANAENQKSDYISVSDAWDRGHMYDTWSDGWASDAFAKGASWGDNLVSSFKDKFSLNVDLNKTGTEYDFSDYDFSDLSDSSALTAENTGKTADAVSSASSEELEWIRKIAERESVNKFTTAEIKLDFSSTANLNSDIDIDGYVNTFTDELQQALVTTAEKLEK